MRPDEVAGLFFLNLDIGLPVGDLRTPILQTFVGKPPEDVTLEARNGRGRPVDCTVSFAELTSHTGDVDGAILVMTAEPRDETS